MHATIVGMQEVCPVWNEVGMRRSHRAPSPAHRRRCWGAAMLADFDCELYSVFHLVLNPCRTGRHEPPLPCLLIQCHVMYLSFQ